MSQKENLQCESPGTASMPNTRHMCEPGRRYGHSSQTAREAVDRQLHVEYRDASTFACSGAVTLLYLQVRTSHLVVSSVCRRQPFSKRNGPQHQHISTGPAGVLEDLAELQVIGIVQHITRTEGEAYPNLLRSACTSDMPHALPVSSLNMCTENT